jgi:hypothetical protein
MAAIAADQLSKNSRRLAKDVSTQPGYAQIIFGSSSILCLGLDPGQRMGRRNPSFGCGEPHRRPKGNQQRLPGKIQAYSKI